jgi:hypothetical protein
MLNAGKPDMALPSTAANVEQLSFMSDQSVEQFTCGLHHTALFLHLLKQSTEIWPTITGRLLAIMLAITRDKN